MRLVITSKNINAIQSRLPEAEREKVKPDDYLTKILKYIPAEVVALYVTLYNIAYAARADIPFTLIVWIIFGIGIIGTVLYLLRVAKVNDWSQITVSTIAFVVWVFALGGPFSHCAWYQPAYGALILPIYTFFMPIMISR